jgi:hypothetical protein
MRCAINEAKKNTEHMRASAEPKHPASSFYFILFGLFFLHFQALLSKWAEFINTIFFFKIESILQITKQMRNVL